MKYIYHSFTDIFVVISKKYLPNPRSQGFFPMFSSERFVDLGFID